MLERHLKSPVTRDRLRAGPSAAHVDDFADWLQRQGYRPITIDTMLRSLAGWTDWLGARGFGAHNFQAGYEACKVELEDAQRARHRRDPNRKSLTAATVFLRFLEEEGVLPKPAAPPTPS